LTGAPLTPAPLPTGEGKRPVENEAPKPAKFYDDDMGKFEWDEDKNLINKRYPNFADSDTPPAIFPSQVFDMQDAGGVKAL
jgi:hypothetical protein